MLRRAVPLAVFVLVACAVGAVAVPKAGAPAPRVAPVAVEGAAASWNAARSTIALAEAAPVRGPRFARRAVASARRLVVTLAPSTVLVTEEDDGYRERVEAADLFAVLDEWDEALGVEASGRLTVPRPGRGRATLAAKRVIVHLPPPDEDDPYADDVEGLPDDPLFDEEPVIDPDDPDLGD